MKKRVLIAVVITVMAVNLLASTSMIIGATGTTSSTVASSSSQTQKRGCKPKGAGHMLREDLSGAVSAGVITSTESSSITTFLSTYKPAGKVDVYTVLVENKILTQEKADALKAYFKTQEALRKEEMLKSKLSSYVSDKTITQAQANKIIATILATESGGKSKTNPLSVLVSDNTLTQTQADIIWKALHPGKRGQSGSMGKECKGGNCQTTSSSATSSGSN